MTGSLTGQRDRQLDAVKGIGILLMVLGHAYFILTTLHRFIYAFHMPLFFMISGFVLRAETLCALWG